MSGATAQRGWKARLRETARRNRMELVHAKLSRRELFKLGLLTTSGYLVTKLGLSARAAGADGGPSSPPTTPWVEELPVPPVKTQSLLDPAPIADVNTAMGEMGRTAHQSWARFYDPANVDTYEIQYRVAHPVWHRELPPDDCWLFDGVFPGPWLHGRYGRPMLVRFRNLLPTPDQYAGYGSTTMTTHLHNGHTPSESDGNPVDGVAPGYWKDHFYPNVLAGFNDPAFAGTAGDPREALSSLWYHDHRVDFTAQNVYRGLAGVCSLFNEFDSGDENDPNPAAFHLPSGAFDVPLVFHDRVFDAHGIGYYDLFNLDGILGDKFSVNGKINPVLRVARRKYRFRTLNIGPSRWYEFFLSNGQDMLQITEDGNLLPAPYRTKSIRLAVAERKDIVLDFSGFPSGSELYLVNCLDQTDGRGPSGDVLSVASGTKVLRFVVDATIDTLGDPSRVPDRFYDLPPVNLNEVVAKRRFEFKRDNGAWTVNGRTFDPDFYGALPRQGTAEQWTVVNSSGGWMHPVHIHLEEHQILSRNGSPPRPNEVSRKDVIELGHGESIHLFMRFRDWLGRYPMHCHNVVHEDHAMMVMWKVVP